MRTHVLIALFALSTTGCSSVVPYRFTFDGTSHVQRGVRVHATPDYHGVTVQVHNRSSEAVLILWDESSFVDAQGIAHPVVHTGIQLAERTQPQLPTVIPPKAMVRQRIVATDLVRFNRTRRGNQWDVKDHLPRGRAARQLVGKSIRLYLQLASKEQRRWQVDLTMKVKEIEQDMFLQTYPRVRNAASHLHARLDSPMR